MGSQKFTNGYLGIHIDELKCLNLWQMVAKIIEEYFWKSYLMLHEWLKVKKDLLLGSEKFYRIKTESWAQDVGCADIMTTDWSPPPVDKLIYEQ